MNEKFKFGNPFCSLPFLQQHLDSQKKSKICCHSNNVIQSEIDFNSNKYKEIRNDMLSGTWPTYCKICKDLESRKLISPRQKTLKTNNNELLQKQVAKHMIDEALEPYQYDLRISNLCNLACIMCGPLNSSTIAKRLGLDERFLSYEPDIYINANSNYMYLAGGEPFLIKKFPAMLDKIQNLDCEIVVNTNGTIVTDALLNSLKRFHNVNMTVSIDGYQDLNAKIREGSEWEKILSSLDIFKSSGFSIHVNTVVQKYNVNSLYELGSFLEKFGITKWTLNELLIPEELHYSNAELQKERIKNLMNLNLVKSNLESIYLLNSIIK